MHNEANQDKGLDGGRSQLSSELFRHKLFLPSLPEQRLAPNSVLASAMGNAKGNTYQPVGTRPYCSPNRGYWFFFNNSFSTL